MKKQERRQKYDQIREMYEPVVRAKNYAMRQMIETGKKMGKLRYLMLAVLFIFLFTYHFFFAIFTQLKMREKLARAFSMIMVVVLVFTSVDVTVFAATWNSENGKDYSIVSVETLSDDLLTQKLPVGATEDQIRFPETLTVTIVDNTAPVATATPEVTEQPTVTEAPTTGSPEVTEVPETTETPVTEAPATEAPAASEEPVQSPETTDAPDVTETPAQETPTEPEKPAAEPDVASESDAAPASENEAGPVEQKTEAEQPAGEVSRAGQILSDTMNLLFPAMKVYAAENIEEVSANATETVNVTWKLDERQSSGSQFDSGIVGNKYVYVPVFPDQYVVETEIPAITVEITDATKVLTGFAGLETTVANQEIRLKGSLKDLTFPESMKAQVEEYTDGTLLSTDEVDVAVTWKWREDKSQKDLRELDSFETLSIGDTFVYEAVLADSTYRPAEDLEYPTITIRVVDTPAFEQSVVVDGVTITVTADEGVLPEGASVKAESYEDLNTLYTTADVSALENYVQGFDVSVVDKKGVEIQPDTTKGEVHVHFSNPSADGSVETGDWDIFHYDEEKNVLEALDTILNEGKDEVTAVTDSFSPFLLTARASGNTYNLSNGSVTLRASRDDGAVITGSGTNRNIRIENDTNSTCTMTVTLQDINIERSIIFIETYKQTTNVIFNIVGSVQIYSKKQVTMQKNGGGVTNVYLNADNYFQRDGSYIFSLQDVSMSKKVIDGGINLSLYNGTVATTALSNFSLERKTFSQAVASGQKKAHRVYFALVGYTDILKDLKTTEVVRAGLPYLVSEPNLRGKRFIGYYSRVLKSTGWFSFKYEEQTYPAGSYITLEPDMTNYFELQYEDILNTVNLNVTLDGNTWGGKTVELRHGDIKVYDLTRSGSIYTNDKVINGTYDVYVDGEDSYYDVTVDCDDQSIQVNQNIAYTSTNIQTRLDNSYSDAPGEVTLEKDGRVYYTLAGNSGNHNKPMPNAALPLDIYVNNEDTEFDLTTGNANPVIDFYTMEMSIMDDTPWTTATVQLKDGDGIAVAKLEYDSTTGSNTTVYKRIMQMDTEHHYTVYIDGVDTGKTVSVTNEGRKASFTYYTVTAKITGIPGCEINLTSGADRKRLYQDGDTSTYTAEHVYKRSVDGAELDYRLIVVGTVDDNENIINSNQKQFEGNYHTVTYYNSRNTKATNDGKEEQVAVRFLYVRDGSKISNYTGNVLRSGYTFSHWSTKQWSPETDMSSCPEFDYDTKIESDINLYAVYQEPNISIGGLIYTDENGMAGGNGKYYRMGNMVITGFSPSDEAIKYVNLVTKNTEKIVIDPKGYGVKSVQLGSAVQTAGSDGKYVIKPGDDGDRLAIYFEPCVSMARAQDLIRNIIVQPKEKVEHSMTVEVVDAGGEYVAANKVTGIYSTISNPLPKAAAKNIDNLPAGSTLTTGVYYITKNKDLDRRYYSDSALKISGTVYLYIPEGVTLSAYGGGYNQNRGATTSAGYAGIYVPDGSNLYLLGEGTVMAYGGNAGNGENGSDGSSASNSSKSKSGNVSGAGGKGGSGGGGAGAGIGTNGAQATSHSGTTYGNGGSNYGALDYKADRSGQTGNAGASSRSADKPGFIYIDSKLNLGGSGGTSGRGGSSGTSGYFWIDNGSKWDAGWTALGAGGGGAGGGGGYAGALVGYGGASGAGGGGGASGGHYAGGSKDSGRTIRNGSGGQGGWGGNNGASGDTNQSSSRYSSYDGGNDGNNRFGASASGGSSGSSGSAGSNTRKTSSVSMPTYRLTFDVSSASGATKPTDITYYFGDSRTITMPTYVNSNPYVNFLGWEIKGYAGSETVKSGTDAEFVQNKLGKRYLSGSSYTIAQGTYGNIELVAVTETLGGIYKKDAITPYTYTANAAAQQYYTYQVDLTKDGEPYTVGNIKIGDRTVSPDQNGKYSIMVAGTTTPQPLSISVNGEDAGLAGEEFDPDTRISNTTVAFRSIRVLVEDSSEENAKLHKVEIKSTSNGKAPILVAGNAVQNADGCYVTEYTYVTLASKATDEEYQIWIDGADIGQTVSYSNPTTVKFYTVTMNIHALGFSPDQIGMVELRSGKERLFADFVSQDQTQSMATFVYTKLEDAEHNYQIYIDNVLAGEFIYNGNESGEQVTFTQDYDISIEKKRYTTIVETYQDGQLRDSGVLKLDDRKMVRTGTGRYEIVTDENASSDLYVNGRKVKTGVEVGKSTPIKVNYYTIQYVLNDEEPNDMGELPKDRTIYLEGDSVTMPSGENLKNGGKTFVGWTIDGTTYSVGDPYSITGTTRAIATWKQTSFDTTEEKFYVSLGANEFTYNGESQIPNIVVTRGRNTLNASTDGGVTGDYIVSFQNSNTCNDHNDSAGGIENTINAGTVTVIITGINDYTGTLTAKYGIRQREISVGGLKAVDKVYDGDPTVEMDVSSAYLEDVVEGDDVRFTDHATATTHVATAGNQLKVDIENQQDTADEANVPLSTMLTGEASANYTLKELAPIYVNVAPKQITADMFTLSQESYIYHAEECRPEITATDHQEIHGETVNIMDNNDVAVTYVNNVNAGTATVVITADIATEEEIAEDYICNYTGTVEKTFTIEKAPITITAKAADSKYSDAVTDVTNNYDITEGKIYTQADRDDLAIRAVTGVKSDYTVGTYKNAITIQYNEQNTNYAVTTKTADYTVLKSIGRLPLFVEGYAGVYDGEVHCITATPSVADKTAKIYYSRSPLTQDNYATEGKENPEEVGYKDAATQPYTIYYYATSDYYSNNAGEATVQITKKLLDITAKPQTVVYGEKLNDMAGITDVEISGWANEEDQAAIENAMQISFTSDSYQPGGQVGQIYDVTPKIENEGRITALGNYQVKYHAGDLTVESRKVTFAWPVTTFVYTGKEQQIRAEILNVLDADKAEVSVELAGDVKETEAADNYAVQVAGLTGAKAGNYIFDPTEQIWSVTQAKNAWIIEPAQPDYAEGSDAPAPVGSAKYGQVKFTYYADKACETPMGEAPDKAGTYWLKAVSEDVSANYTPLEEKITEFTVYSSDDEINKTQLVYATVQNMEVVYGSGLPESVTVSYRKQNGDAYTEADKEQFLDEGSSLKITTDYQQGADVGEYHLTADGLVEAEGYKIVYVPGKLTVTPKEVSLVWPAEADTVKTYNGLVQGITATLDTDSLYVGDDAYIGSYVLDGSNTNFADKVGEYTAIVQSLAGKKAGNYVLPEDCSHSWKILPVTEVTESIFTVQPDIEDWYYGETPSVPVGESTLGTVEFKYQEVKDDVLDWNIFNWKTTERPIKPGRYRLIGYVDNGAGKQLECEPIEFQIKKAEVAVIIDSKESVYGTELEALTSRIEVLRGQLTEKEIAEVQSTIQLTTEATTTSNAGEYPITVKDAGDNKIIGTDYADGSFIKGKYTITNAKLTASAQNVTVTYDGKQHTIAAVEIQGDAAGKAVVYYSTSQLTDDNYGSGSLVPPTITNAGEQTIYYYVKADNYEPVTGSAKVTVTQKELKVTANNAQIFFGEAAPDYAADPNSHVTYEGFADGENEQTLQLTPVFSFGKEAADGWIAYTNTSSCGEYVIKPQLTGVDNYKFIYEKGTLSVTKKDLSNITTSQGDPVNFETLFTLEIPEAGYTYDGTAKEPKVVIKSQNLITVTENDYTVSYKNNVDAGTATVTVTATEQGNLSGTLERNFAIGKREITVTADAAESYYGENIASLSYNVTSGTILEDDKDDLKLTAETSVKKGTAVGTYPDAVTVSYKENRNYEITVEGAAYTVKAKAMTVTVEDYTGVYDGKAHTGKVTVKTGTLFHPATVYYSDIRSLDESNYTEASTDIPKYTDAGATRTVYYYAVCEGYDSQAGQFTVTIENRPLTLNWTLNKEESQSAEVDDTPAEVKASIDGNVVFGDHLSVTEYKYYRNDGMEITDEELEEALKQAGEYTVTAEVTGEGAGNYVVSNSRFNFQLYSTSEGITQVENSIDLTATGWQYGAEHASATAHAKYGQAQYTYYLGDGTTLTTRENSGAADEGAEPVNPGEYQVKAVVDETESYKEASATQNFTISKAKIRIIANDVTGQYGKKIADLSGEYTMEGNIVKGDDIQITLSTDATKESPIGSYPITVSVTGSDSNSKYDVTTVSGTYFVVGAQDAIQVTAEGYAGTYDGASHGITVRVTDRNGKPVNDVTVYYSMSELTDTNYGFGSKTPLSVTDAGETEIFYYVASDKYAAVAGSKIVNIAKKPVTVMAGAKTIVYGEEKPADGSVVVNGLLGEDTLSGLNIKPSVSYQYEQYEDVGTYDIATILSDYETTNYIFETQPGRLTVTPAPVTFRWSQASLSYTGEVQKMKAAATPLWNNDNVVVVLEQDGSQAVMPGEYVARVSRLSGDKAGNYTFDPADAAASQNWSIDQADNTFTTALSMEGWTYGETPKVPEAVSRFGQVSFSYYKDALCEQPTDSAEGASTEGGVPENPGDYYVKAYVPESNEYAAIEAVEKFTISKSIVTILVDNQYGALKETPKELTYQIIGSVSEKAPVQVSLELKDLDGNRFEQKQFLQTGNYKIAATVDYDQSKYDVTIQEATYYVSENGISVTAKDVTVTYDAGFHNIEVVVTRIGNTEQVPEEDYKIYYKLQPATDAEKEAMKVGSTGSSILTSSPECKSAGRTVVYYYVVYEDELYEGNAVVTIRKAPLRVIANDCEISQGSIPTINNGVTYEGFVGEEDESSLSGQISYQYSYTKDQPEGEYSITPKGLISSNYELQYIPGKLTVLPVAVTTEIIDVQAENAVYDGENHPGYVGTPTAGDGEVTEFIYEYKTKDGTRLDSAPKDAGEYIVTIKIPNTNLHYKGEKDIAFTIAKRPIQVRLQNQAMMLGQKFEAAKPEYVGFIGNDNENNKAIASENITAPVEAATTVGKFSITYTGELTEEAMKNYTLITPTNATLTVFAIPAEPGKDESGSSVRLDEQDPDSGIVKIAVIKEEEHLPETEIEADFTIEVAEALLDEDEINAVKGGENALVYLLLSEAEQTTTAEEKQKIAELAASIAKDVNIGLYLDLSLYKKVGDKAPSKITQTGEQTVTIEITLPESLKVKAANVERTYYIIYVHDGEAKQITPQYKDGVLTFEASEFSVYTIAYKDTAKPSGGDVTPTPAPGGDATPTPTSVPGGDATPTPTPVPGGDATPTPAPGGDVTPTPAPGGDVTPTPVPGGDVTPTPAPGDHSSGDSGNDATPAPAVTQVPGTTAVPASGSNRPQGGRKPGNKGSDNSTGQAEQPETSIQPETTAQPENTAQPETAEQPGTTTQPETVLAGVKEKDKLPTETKKRLEEALEKVTKVDAGIQAGPYVQPQNNASEGSTGGNAGTTDTTILVEIPDDLRLEGRTFYLMTTDADGNIIILPNESLEDGMISVSGSADAVYQIIYEDGGSTLTEMLTGDGKLTNADGKVMSVSTNHCLWHWLILVITLLGLGAIALLGRKKKKYILFFGAVTTVLNLIVAIIGFCTLDWIFLITGILLMLLLAVFLHRGRDDDSHYAAQA